MEQRKRINPGPALDGNFIPRWLFKRSEISLGARAVYSELGRLMTDDGRLQVDRLTIAERLGIRAKHLDRYLKELKLCGLIGIRRNGHGRPSSYFFFHHSWMEAEPAEVTVLDQPSLDLDDFPKQEIKQKTLMKTPELPKQEIKTSLLSSLNLKNLTLKRGLEEEVSKIIGKINSLSGKRYKATSKNIAKYLIVRMEEDEDATLENCLLVVEHRWRKWGEDNKMFENFNPVTIFRKANFEKYLVEAQAAKEQGLDQEWEPPEVRAARK